MRRLLLPLLLVFVACASPPEPKPRPVSPVEAKTALPAPRADGRLPDTASPRGYTVAFDVDPNKERFAGTETIAVHLPAPTSYVVLHARNLDVSSARATANGKTVDAKVSLRRATGGDAPEELVLDFDHVLPAGDATIALAWTGPFDRELSGLYRVKEGDRWYAFTQFESTDARRAFPCFDEPGFKVPFEVSVKAPTGMIAVANTPERSRDGGTFRFEKTPPLPTYLVAIAVGEFDVKELAGPRARAPKIRIVTTKGKSGLGDLALEATAALVDGLGDWFGIPYPYAKLDIVAVPEFAAGAMENPGLVTFRSELLLLDPARSSVRIKRSQAAVVAHELAHQWFGDLVTAAWWNDIWLNEGMATWMEWHAVDRWKPEWHVRDDAAASALAVMDDDGLAHARAVRQPVKTTSEIEEAFDGITYEKGGAVLATIERWVGEDAFQRGIRAYLKENAWKSVTTDRLFAALDRETGKDVSGMASKFLDVPGVPMVELARACEGGNRWHVELSQERWKPLGSSIDGSRSWTIPVCLRAAGEKKEVCAELSGEGAPSIAAGRGCPAWIHPNAFGSYYRFDLPEKEMLALGAAAPQLDVPQRVSLLSNAWASVRAGKASPAAVLKLLKSFDDDRSRQVTTEIIGILYSMDDVLVDAASRPAFAKYVAARFAKRKKTQPATSGPSEDDVMVGRSVMGILGDLAGDEATLHEAEKLAAKWLADPASIEPEIAPTALDLASRHAGAPRLAELRAAVKNAKTDEDRVSALRALAGFDDPAVLRAALDLTLTDEIRVHDMRYVIGSAFNRKPVRDVTEAWVREHWDALVKRLPGSLGHVLLRGVGNACTKEATEERRAWYAPKAAAMPGAQRGFEEAIETDTLCDALHRAAAKDFAKALE